MQNAGAQSKDPSIGAHKDAQPHQSGNPSLRGVKFILVIVLPHEIQL